MARTARVKSESGVYHIVLRGINKQTVFYDDEDREVFLNRIKLAKKKTPFEIYAFCFMDNHMHILLREKEVALDMIMRQLLSGYVFWYNSKYERIGNLFQDRFKSEPVESDEYLLCAARYIHQNPVKAGLVKEAGDYKWSSYNAYLFNQESLIDKHLLLSILQGEASYKAFMAIPEVNGFLESAETFKISDDKLLKEIKKRLNINEMHPKSWTLRKTSVKLKEVHF